MTQAYRKRMKGDWRQGKRHKGDAEERQFAKREIQQQLDADEEDYLERYHKGKRTKNEKARLEYRIAWYQLAIAKGDGGHMWIHYLQSGLQQAKKDLNKLLEKE